MIKPLLAMAIEQTVPGFKVYCTSAVQEHTYQRTHLRDTTNFGGKLSVLRTSDANEMGLSTLLLIWRRRDFYKS